MKSNKIVALHVGSKRGIMFDLFHTLTTVESSWADGRPSTCEMLGVSREAWHEQLLERSRERLVGEVKDPVEIIRRMANAIDPGISMETIKAAAANRIERFAGALVNIPDDTLRVLRTLRDMGKRLALVSNADVSEVTAWERSPLKPFFDVVVFSCEVGHVKPEREIYELCLRRLGLAAEDCVFIGDGGSNELEGAKRVGLSTVMVTGIIEEIWPDAIAERRRHADFEVSGLRELM